MGQQIVLVGCGTCDLELLKNIFPSTSSGKDVFLSASHHLVMIKTGGLQQPVAGNCTPRPGLEKRAIVATLWLLLVLRETRAQVLAPARPVIDGSVCRNRLEWLHMNEGAAE